MLAAAAQQTFTFCNSDRDCPSRGGPLGGGGRSTPATLRLEARDAFTHAKLSGVTFRIYSNFGSGWMGCSGRDCGTLVSYLYSDTSGDVALVPGGQVYLIVAVANGYYSAWSTMFVGYSGSGSTVGMGGAYASFSSMISTLGANELRLVLRWPHGGDLDLWVMNNSDLTHNVGAGRPRDAFGSGHVSLDHTSSYGSAGPESTHIGFLKANATLGVWVHSYEHEFSLEMVRDFAASVDVYCSGCYQQGQRRRAMGWLSTVTQRTQFLPSPYVKWWRAGNLVTRSDGRVEWEPCTSYCFGPAPVSQGVLSLTSRNLPVSRILAGPLTYMVLKGYSSLQAVADLMSDPHSTWVVSGTAPFHVNWLNGQEDILFHFNPLATYVMMNTYQGGLWGPEEKLLSQPNASWTISVDAGGFHVIKDKSEVYFFKHRLAWSSFSVTQASMGVVMHGPMSIMLDSSTTIQWLAYGTVAGACAVPAGEVDACRITLASDSVYMVMTEATGFLTNFVEIYVGIHEVNRVSNMVPILNKGQNRVVLHWGHTKDMDLWIIDSTNTANRVGWLKKTANFGFGNIILDRDVLVGPGVETTQLANLSNHSVQVWVNHYGEESPVSRVRDFPATIDIYCHACSYSVGGVLVSKVGYVTSLTQNASKITHPQAVYRWWKVGEFISSATGAVKWQACETNCYTNDQLLYQGNRRNSKNTPADADASDGDSLPEAQLLRAAASTNWYKTSRAVRTRETLLSPPAAGAFSPSSEDGEPLKRGERRLLDASGQSPFTGTWAHQGGTGAVLQPGYTKAGNSNNSAFFDAYDSIGDYKAYWSNFCCSIASAISQTMAAGCYVTSSQIRQRIAQFMRFESGGVCANINCPHGMMSSVGSGDREVMARVPHVQALRWAIAGAINMTGISWQNILIVEVCESWGCSDLLHAHHHHSYHESQLIGRVSSSSGGGGWGGGGGDGDGASSDSVQVKFQVLSQSPAHSQLEPFVHLDIQAVRASMQRHSFVRLIESGMAQRGVAIGRATLGYVSETACPLCTLPLTWLQLRAMETHQRQVFVCKCVCVCVCVCVKRTHKHTHKR